MLLIDIVPGCFTYLQPFYDAIEPAILWPHF